MTRPQTPKEVSEEAEILHTGRWYIAELEEPQLAVQGESESDARQKLAKRWEKFTAGPENIDIRLGTSNKEDDDQPIESSATQL
jgi:hypothetical protein